MLARSVMIVVIVPDEMISPGRRMLDGGVDAYGLLRQRCYKSATETS